MGARAVVFDFYGTVVVSARADVHRAGADRVAAALGTKADAYYAALTSTFTERATGSCGDMTATMRWLALRCGHEPTSSQLANACAVRRSVEESYARALRPEAEATLAALRSRGVKIGLVSDCTHELPEVWPSLPVARYFDARIFSVDVGIRKPDPRLYAAVAQSLGVAPSECLYIGDGGSGELTGAAAAGMSAYLLKADDAAHAVVYDAEREWKGPVVHRLSEVLSLVSEVGVGRRSDRCDARRGVRGWLRR